MKRARFILLVIVILSMTAGVFGSVNAQALNGGCGLIHTVVRGENLFRIALHYNTTVAKLQADNGIYNPNFIYAGQQLCIIGVVSNPPPAGTAYVVQYGDTLGRIAQRFGVNMWVLARVNNIVNLNLIYAGQRLTIPDVTIQ